MAKHLVRLKRSWPGEFRRSVRRDGETVRVLRFSPGEPVELNDEDFAACKDDVGPALEEIVLDASGRPRLKSEANRQDAKNAKAKKVGQRGKGAKGQSKGPEGPPASALAELGLPEAVVKTLERHELGGVDVLRAFVREKELTELDGIGGPTAEKILAALEKTTAPTGDN